MKILLIAYACEPNRGSEPGTGWNLAFNLAKNHDVTVITRPNNRSPIELQLLHQGNPGLTFLYIDPPSFLIYLKRIRILSVQTFYVFWQRAVSKTLNGNNHFDIVHQLTFNSFEIPPPFLKISNSLLIWGPIGGGQMTPRSLLGTFGVIGSAREAIRNLRVRLSANSKRVKDALRKSSLVLFANQETRFLLNRHCSGSTSMMIDVGVDIDKFVPPVSRSGSSEVTIMFAGVLEGRKGIILLLEAFHILTLRHSNIQLRIVGDGPLRGYLEKKSTRLRLKEKVAFTGPITHEMMVAEFTRADIFCFPSLRDTSGAVVIEAMSMELPIVSFDHQGSAIMVPNDCGLRAATGKRSDTVNSLVTALDQLIQSPQLRISLGKRARSVVKEKYDWSAKAKLISEHYESLLAKLK